MPLRNMRTVIGATGELSSVREQARRQAALQQAFVDSTPVELAQITKASRVGYIKAGTLYLFAEHAAVAAKLRQLLPRLLPLFRKLEAEITAIKVEVQVTGHAKAAPLKPKGLSLPIESIEKFRTLAASVRDQDLKLAITNLVDKRSRPRR
jgi:type IV secretory pathway protease TraF